MSVKITKTGVGKEKEDLLFEFLPHELPDHISIKYVTALGKSRFVGSLQNNQVQGAYLEPITFSGMFFGTYVTNQGTIINAKERSDELGKLQGRIIKFYYENFKTLAIIEDFEKKIYDYGKIEYTITFQPHDIQNPIRPSVGKTFAQNSIFNANLTLPEAKGTEEMKDGFDNFNKKFEGDVNAANAKIPQAPNDGEWFKYSDGRRVKLNPTEDKNYRRALDFVSRQDKAAKQFQEDLKNTNFNATKSINFNTGVGLFDKLNKKIGEPISNYLNNR